MNLSIPKLDLANFSELEAEATDSRFRMCLAERYNFDPVTIDPSTWTCSIALTATDLSFDGLAPDQTAGCDQSPFALTAQNWKDKHVEVNLQIALDGGVDEYGVFWEGRRKQEPIATTIGRQFWDQLSEQCSIKDPCAPDINCERIGSYTGLALGRLGRPLKLPWVVLVSDAVKNLNLQLRNTFDQVLNAINSLALDAFYIDEFSPAKDPDTDIKDNLAGLGSILTILGGIIPVAGQTLDVAGTITSGIGGFIANAAPPDPLAAQKTFATNVLAYYEGLRDGLERFTTQLFAGAQISGPAGSFDLFALMKEGVWVGPDALTDVSQLNRDIRTEVTARSIDAIWKTWPSNKMWVLFTDLQDHEDHKKCLQDTTGPEETKYCADGGVYYAYNFIQDGAGGGDVGARWNWDYTKTPPPFGKFETHPPCICGALALETYDWAKAAGLQGFETFWGRCKVAMRRGHFDWPDGVTFVDYPTNNGDEVHKIHKP
ncbi:MAG: hypothetical protein LQ346_006508 [Caloplaca aetnensis]|nr:MAG: hypothetical protein LQ346_006508 [Caloplaca aetnensis]